MTGNPAAIGGVSPKGRDDSVRMAAIERRRKERPAVYWYLSFRCNLACEHCAVSSSPWIDVGDDLTTERALEVVDQFAELNVSLVTLTGGEVLLRRDALLLIRALADRGIRVGLETNGLRIDRRFAETARELQARDLLVMSVSLDGGTREAHERLRGPRTFDRTIRNLDLLADHGVSFGVQAVINRTSYPTIPDLFELALGWGRHLDSLQFMFLNPLGRGSDLMERIGLRRRDMEIVFELIRRGLEDFDGYAVVKAPLAVVPPRFLGLVLKNPKVLYHVSCQFPLLGVLPNGDVTLCAQSRDHEELLFGNIRECNLKEIWERNRMDELRRRYLAAEELGGICGDCLFKYYCKGGCRAWAYNSGGSFDAPLPVCAALAEAGDFPAAYRISRHNDFLARHLAAQAGPALPAGMEAAG